MAACASASSNKSNLLGPPVPVECDFIAFPVRLREESGMKRLERKLWS